MGANLYSNMLELTYLAIDSLNEELAAGLRLEKSVDTYLLNSSRLDSMQLINLLVFIDSEVEAQMGISLALTEDADLLEMDGPLRTVGSLATYLDTKLAQCPSAGGSPALVAKEGQ